VLIAAGALCCLVVVLYALCFAYWFRGDIWKIHQDNVVECFSQTAKKWNDLEEALGTLRHIYHSPLAQWDSGMTREDAREILIKYGTDTDRAFFNVPSPTSSPEPKIHRTQPETWLVEK
jgi:hypothetical protein